jgi:hypothetical protein
MKAKIVATQYDEGGLVEKVEDCYEFDDFESATKLWEIMFPSSQQKMDYYVRLFDNWELISLVVVNERYFRLNFLDGLQEKIVDYSLIKVE